MRLKIAVIGIVLIAACMGGCIGNNDGMTGTYRCEVDEGILDLYGGDQWELIGTECSFGEYSLLHDTIRLKLDGIGILIPFEIDGRDLIDPDGDRWVRD
jgi:hypothetical protein